MYFVTFILTTRNNLQALISNIHYASSKYILVKLNSHNFRCVDAISIFQSHKLLKFNNNNKLLITLAIYYY
jgi:hypothetical protein